MIGFVTLNTIVTDLLNVIRGAIVSQSEPISKRQLEGWVHQYRAMLLKRDLDKGKMPNPDYIQEIRGLKLSAVDEASGMSNYARGEYLLRSDLQIPKTIDLNFKPGFTYVGTVDGHELSFVPESRHKWQMWKKYTAHDPVVFLKDNYLYVSGEDNLKYLTVRGIFEVPTEVINFVNVETGQENYLMDEAYPMPIDKVPVLKEMILKGELGIEARAYSDKTEDSQHEVESNVESQPRQKAD
jgi:hypothetical protein